MSARICAGPGCTEPLPPSPKTGGTERRYCSGRCRARATRERQRGGPPVRTRTSYAPAPEGPVTWEPVLQPPEVPPPPRCRCGGTRIWGSSFATAAYCSHDRLLQLVIEEPAGSDEVVAERRVLSEEEEEHARWDLGARKGGLLRRIDDLLKRDDLPGEGEGWLKAFRDDVRKAGSFAKVVRYEQVLDAELGPGYDSDDVWEVEAESDSWDDEAPDLGGMSLPSVDVPETRPLTAPQTRRLALPPVTTGNPALAWKQRVQGGDVRGASTRPAARKWMPRNPVPGPADQGAQVISITDAIAERDAQHQVTLQQYLDAGLIHEAIALATGRRPEYPASQAVTVPGRELALLPRLLRRRR